MLKNFLESLMLNRRKKWKTFFLENIMLNIKKKESLMLNRKEREREPHVEQKEIIEIFMLNRKRENTQGLSKNVLNANKAGSYGSLLFNP